MKKQLLDHHLKTIFRDGHFYLCLGLGPMAWWLIAYFQPVRDYWALPQIAWYHMALIILVYPLLEEIVFRGLVQEFFTSKIRYRLGILSGANLLTSLVFVAMHIFYSQWIWALVVFFPSLVFGYLKERHQSLVSPILVHAFYNAGYFWFFWQN